MTKKTSSKINFWMYSFFALCLLFVLFVFISRFQQESYSTENNYKYAPPIAENLVPTQLPPTNPLPTMNLQDAQSYTDVTFKYTIKYPSILLRKSINPRVGLLGGTYFIPMFNDNKIRERVSEVYVGIFDSNNLTLNEWLTANSTKKPFGSSEEKEIYDYKKLGDTYIEGLPAIQYQNKVFGHVAINTAVKKGNYIYRIGTITVANDDLTEVYKSMLSTFRFL